MAKQITLYKKSIVKDPFSNSDGSEHSVQLEATLTSDNQEKV